MGCEVETGIAGPLEGGLERRGGSAGFVTTDTEGDDVFTREVRSELGYGEGVIATELPHGVQDPANLERGAAALFQQGVDDGMGIVAAPEVDAGRVDDLGIDDALGMERGEEFAGGEAVVVGGAQAQDDELEGLEEVREASEAIDRLGIGAGKSGIEAAKQRGVDAAFQVQVQFSERL